MGPERRSKGVLFIPLAAMLWLSLGPPRGWGQSPAYGPYEHEWTRFHPHFMGHRDKAWIELQAERKAIATANVRDRESFPVEVSLKVGKAQNQFDLYLALALEGGVEPFDENVLFFTPAGTYSSRPQPYEANVTLTADRKFKVTFPLYSALLPKAYTIWGVLVPPGADPLKGQNWIQIASTTFAYRRDLAEPLEVGEQGNLYVARNSFPKPDWLPPGPLVVGPLGANQGMYVNYQAPYRRAQPYPIVYIHG